MFPAPPLAEFVGDNPHMTSDPLKPQPELRAEAITASAVEQARAALFHAALEFDIVEDDPEQGDWRLAFSKMRETAEALGCVKLLDYYGIG